MDDCCKDVVEALGDRDSLAPADEQTVVAHLARCANCRAMDSGLRAIPALVRAGIDGLVATTDERVRDVLRRSLTPEDEQALRPTLELLKKG